MPTRTFSLPTGQYTLDVRPDRLDLRDRPYQPPPLSLPQQWPLDKDVRVLFPRYIRAGLVLDQGPDGACTGFGLAAVVNYLLWRRSLGDAAARFEAVSPHMLYDLARFYDEWPGQDYEGSSCRGAMKGWHKHGACRQDLWTRSIYASPLPPKGRAAKARRTPITRSAAAPYLPDALWPGDAARRPVGVYYRVDRRSVTDMQAALHEVGAIYVSGQVHAGWGQVPTVKGASLSHARLPRIPFDAQQAPEGGHAFALVGYNDDGFVVQNSWGTGWGLSGFAVLAYDDWVAHGTDAWVCALGVPQSRGARASAEGNPARSVGRVSLLSGDKPLKVKPSAPLAQPWPTALALQHSIVAGNDGEVVIGRPDHATAQVSVASVVVAFAAWARGWAAANPGRQPRLAVYAHGGLNDEASAIERARVLGPYLLQNGVYPIFYIWKTGFLEVLQQEAMDRKELDGAQALATGLLGDARDRLLEAIAHGPLRFMWRQMKQNAEAARAPDRALGLLREALRRLGDTLPFETHYVAHSAGSFVVGHLMALGQAATSVSLMAPACSLAFALAHIRPHAPDGRIALHLLTPRAERQDITGLKPPLAYGKSLLWLVARGFEDQRKTPLAGLAHCLDASATQPDDDLWRADCFADVQAWRDWVRALKPLPDGSPAVRQTASHRVNRAGKTITGAHGGFDNDVDVISQAIGLMTGQGASALVLPVEDLDY